MLTYNQKVENKYDVRTLPVPELQETMDKFLKWVQPLVSSEDYEEGKKQVELFATSQVATELQQILEKKAESKDENWLIEWWLKYVYLSSRGPVTPECNAPMIVNLPSLTCKEIHKRIAYVLHAATVFYHRFKSEGIPDFKIKDKQYSLDQVHGLLAAIRIPRVGVDEYYINDKQSSNILFCYKNRMFNIEVIRDNQPVSYNEIANVIEQIITHQWEAKVPNANYIGLGTNRDDVAVLLDEILKDEKNKQAHELVKNSILCASYDDYICENEVDMVGNILYHKDDMNRWHGKSVSLMFTKDGNIGIVADHTYVDGGTEAYFLQEVDRIIGMIEPTFEETSPINTPKEIEFELSTEVIQKLDKYKEDYIGYINNIKFELMLPENLNRKILKDNGVVSGDGFIHIAFQMAQKKTFGKYYNTYIAVDNRTFFKGRTECVRPVSQQSVAFIEAFMNKGKSWQEQFDLMQESLNEHYRRTKECQAGYGVNRHLFGLSVAYKEKGKEYMDNNPVGIFDTTIWETISSNRLSTSSVPSPYIKKLCFQPVEDKGFGIGYVVGDQSYIFISSYEEDIQTRDQFINYLQESIDELIQFIQNREAL